LSGGGGGGGGGETKEQPSMGLGGHVATEKEDLLGYKLTTMGKSTHDGIWDVAKPVKPAPKGKAKLNKKYLLYQDKFNAQMHEVARKKQLRKHQLRLHNINDGIRCFLRNHCAETDQISSVATPIAINHEILENLSNDTFSKEDREMCEMFEKEMKESVDDDWEEEEWIGSST